PCRRLNSLRSTDYGGKPKRRVLEKFSSACLSHAAKRSVAFLFHPLPPTRCLRSIEGPIPLILSEPNNRTVQPLRTRPDRSLPSACLTNSPKNASERCHSVTSVLDSWGLRYSARSPVYNGILSEEALMKLNPHLVKSTVVAALGGLLFGFDTAVIAGTTGALRETYHPSPDSLWLTVG